MKVFTSLFLLLGICATSFAQVLTFHNVPYAHAERYESPVMVNGWDRTADYTRRGPQCPQTVTINDMFKAGSQPPADDCLVLSINTPAMDGDLPVVVFIHGGSHHHGSGEWEVYDCSGLAEEQNIVTVSMSFRHGVFGYLYDDERENSSLGYEDQVAALRWIQQNIADFGGDPDNVTLTGQSAGAQSVAYLISNLNEKLFKRAILFSAPFFMNQSTAKAKSNAKKFKEILGKDPRNATTDELVEAEKRFKKEVGGGSMPFCPSGLKEYGTDINCGVESVMVTYQDQDAAPFVMNFKKKELEDFGDNADMSLTKTVTNLVFRNGADKLTRNLQRQGVKAQEFKFTWCPPGANWKAAHGLEIAFLFGFEDCILGHGLAGDTTPGMYKEICTSFRKTVADYARTGVWKCQYGEMERG